ncbi:MAG: hypothetical protein ABI675_05605 [Chitinophagaceae bacterium]
MNEESLHTMTYSELIELLNQTRQDHVMLPRDSNEAHEKKEELALILRILVSKRNEFPPGK